MTIQFFDEATYPFQPSLRTTQDAKDIKAWGESTFGILGQDWDLLVVLSPRWPDTGLKLYGAFKSEKDSTYFALRWAGN